MPQDLSFNDVVMPKCYTRVVFVYDYHIDDLEKPFIDFLQHHCPVALGSIIYDDKKPNYGELMEPVTGSHAVFSRADQSDLPISHYINCSFQDLNVFPYAAVPTDNSRLIFLHQVTVRDGTLLAFGIHHHLSDGSGFFNLIDRFSQWFVHRDHSKVPAFSFDRSQLKPATNVRYEHVEYTTVPPTFSFSGLPTMDVIVQRYSKRDLFSKLNITTASLSFNDVLVAWLTQAISRIRQIPANETINVGMAADGRLELGLGADYFGNCNFYVCFQFLMADLLSKSVNELAEQINVVKKQRLTKEYMTSALAFVKNASTAVHPSFRTFLGKDLAFTNWSRFPAYQTDFGQGAPRRMALPPARWNGLVLVLPTENSDVELYIGLKQDHADQLRQQLL